MNPQPKIKPDKDQKYLDWVKTLLCVGCGAPADDAHHVKGYGLSGTGMKAPDYLSMPMCRGDHNKFHIHPKRWEKENHCQIPCIMFTLDEGYKQGKISIDNYEKYTQICLDTWDKKL